MSEVVISARLLWLGESWGCRLPTYRMVAGTVRPTTKDVVDGDGVLYGIEPTNEAVQDLWVDVWVPDSYVWPDSAEPDLDAIRKQYAGVVAPELLPAAADLRERAEPA